MSLHDLSQVVPTEYIGGHEQLRSENIILVLKINCVEYFHNLRYLLHTKRALRRLCKN